MEPHYLQHLAGGHDRNAILNELMTEYGNDVWNFAYFLTRRRDAADDLSQEVFLAVYDRMYSFRGECSIKSWLLTITRNKSINYLNSALLRKVVFVDRIFGGKTAPSAEHVLFDRMETRRIWQAVMRLPRKFREVLIMEVHYELTMQEIAVMLGIAEGTVKSRLHRARKKLAVLLQDEEGEDTL